MKLLTSHIWCSRVYKSNRSVDSTLKLKMTTWRLNLLTKTRKNKFIVKSSVDQTLQLNLEEHNRSVKEIEQAHWKFSSRTTEVKFWSIESWDGTTKVINRSSRSHPNAKSTKNYKTGMISGILVHYWPNVNFSRPKLRYARPKFRHNWIQRNTTIVQDAKQSNKVGLWKFRGTTTELKIWSTKVQQMQNKAANLLTGILGKWRSNWNFVRPKFSSREFQFTIRDSIRFLFSILARSI